MNMVYAETRQLPKSELYGMTAQLNKAAISVANNLAEGSVRATPKDQAHFSNPSYGSLMESSSGMIISTDPGFLDTSRSTPIVSAARDLGGKFRNLRETHLRRALQD